MSEKQAPLRFKLPYSSEEEFLAKFGASLARGAVFVATKAPRPEGTTVAFEFVLGDGSRALAGEGKVVASHPAGPETQRPGMVLRFTRLDPQSRERIERALALREGKTAASPPSPQAPGEGPPSPLASSQPAARPAVTPAGPAAATPAVSSPAPAKASLEDLQARRPVDSRRSAASGTAAGPEPVLGIDLGSSGCRAAIWLDGQATLLSLDGTETALPTHLAVDERRSLLTGNRAGARLHAVPSSGIVGAKRLLGCRASSPRAGHLRSLLASPLAADPSGDLALCVDDTLFSATQLVAALLSEVRLRASAALGRPVSRAVLCAPAHFDDRQRRALRAAGESAALKVERIVSAPAAVAVDFGLGKGIARKRLLVCDFGGGGFDAAVLQATGDDFEVLSAGGDESLAGMEFDRRVADALGRRLAEQQGAVPVDEPAFRAALLRAAETAKRTLSDAHETQVQVPSADGSTLALSFDQTALEAATGDLVEHALGVVRQVLGARHLSTQAIDAVLLVGGQSRMPGIRAALERLFPGRLQPAVHPDDAVARGAALVGRALRDEDPDSFPLGLREVLPASIGIGLRDGSLSRLLDRNTPVPCEKTCALPVGADGGWRFAFFQGESPRAEENVLLGRLELAAPPALGPGGGLVLSVSADGILSLRVRAADGSETALALRTEQPTESERLQLLAAAPEPEKGERGLVGGLRRLFARK